MSFSDEVYRYCRQIPKGKVSTYKELGRALNTKAYQAIGQALRRNPDAPQTPCHRVVAAGGSLHGFKGKQEGKAMQEKASLLEQEGVYVADGKVDLKYYLFSFSHR